MDKKKFSIITYSYLAFVVVLFVFYAVQVADENWVIDLEGQSGNILIFIALLFIGVILSAINLAGIHEKSNKVTKGMVYGGLSIMVLFLVWRVMMTFV